MNTLKLNKGDYIQIQNDSILKCMGLSVAHGTVFTLNDDGKCIGFKCDETGSIECFDDGHITLLESAVIPSVETAEENPDLKLAGISLNQETGMVTLSVDDLEKLKADGLWSIIYQVFMLKLTDFLKLFPFIAYSSDNSDDYPTFWINLPKAFNVPEKYPHMDELNQAVATVIEKLTFKNLKFEHNVSTDEYVDAITPSFDCKHWETSIVDIRSDLQLIADAIKNVEIVPFRVKSKASQKIYVIENDKNEVFYDEKSFLERKTEIESWNNGESIDDSCHVYERGE